MDFKNIVSKPGDKQVDDCEKTIVTKQEKN